MKDDITLILTLKGRQSFTERYLDYICASGIDFPMIIADGDADGFTKNIINLDKYSNLTIDFFEHKQIKFYQDFYLMMLEAVKRVKTKYFILTDNDDFIVKSGLIALKNIAENDPEYISVGGKIFGISISDDAMSTYGKAFLRFYYNDFIRIDEPTEDIEEMILSSLINFESSYYNLLKTNEVMVIFEEIAKLNFTDLRLYEFYLHFRILLIGRAKHISNITHYIRQIGTSSSRNASITKELIRSDLPSDIRKFSKELAKQYNSKYPDIGHKRFYEVFINSFAEYLNYNFAHFILRFRFKRSYRIKKFIFESSLFKLLKKIGKHIQDKRIVFQISKMNKNNNSFLNREVEYIKDFLNK